MPPDAQQLPPDIKLHREPVVFFSVLWKNLFRTIYAGIGAWFTLMEYNVFFPDHHQMVLIDNDPKPTDFIRTLEAVSPYPVRWLEDFQPGVYKAAVFGISRDVIVAEIDYETDNQRPFDNRALAARLFCEKLKYQLLNSFTLNKQSSSGPLKLWSTPGASGETPRPRVTLVLRAGKTRKVLNEDEMIATLKLFPVDVVVHQFDGLGLEEQVSIVENTDVLISMHGAALTHLMFLKPGSYVIELFPFGFRKIIYQNFAKMLKIKYASWQNTKEVDSVFNWESVEAHRYTAEPKDIITKNWVDWRNMDSKNYWRNQDTYVNAVEFGYVLSSVLSDIKGSVKYLIYQPSGTFSSQVLGWKSACAAAIFLNRTLVLPKVGYTSKVVQNFDNRPVMSSMWKPFERYFDLAGAPLFPCATITLDNFVSLQVGSSLGKIRYHLLPEPSSKDQFISYYKNEVQLPYNGIIWDRSYNQLSKTELLNLHGTDTSDVLALGSMFHFYDFGFRRENLLEDYHDYLGDPIYREITAALSFHQRYSRIADFLINKIRDGKDQFVVSVYWQRGKSRQQCLSMKQYLEQKLNRKLKWDDVEVQKCLQTPYKIVSTINEQVPDIDKRDAVYISAQSVSSNEWEEIELMAAQSGWKRVLNRNSLVPWSAGYENKRKLALEVLLNEKQHSRPVVPKEWRLDFDEVQRQMDPIDQLILDMQLCIRADMFIGNMYSTATQLIIDGRTLGGKAWHVF
ncbi:hypothetical protein BJ742DRAFT_816769 [Cladochytrium replicatum]|nr:hypothetical protein BJ742DRAFT_816769 [Cladochytrium replicatum]